MTAITPIVTVIVPLYNTEQYIAECLESITKQTYTNLDILIINDASTDNGPTIVRELQSRDSRIRIIDLKENRGVANARNIGLDNAKGELIAWCDSDDVYHQRFIETLYSIMRITDADFVECKNVNGKDFSTDVFYNVNADSVDYIVGGKEDFLKRFATHQLQTSLWSKLFKKEIFSGYRFPLNRLFEENLFYFHYVSVFTQVAYIDKPLYFYRSRPGSIMKTLREKELEESLLLANDFIAFSDTLPDEHKIAFKLKTVKMLINLWQRSAMADIPFYGKIKWHKRISKAIGLVKYDVHSTLSLSKKERLLLRHHGNIIIYHAYMLYRNIKKHL